VLTACSVPAGANLAISVGLRAGQLSPARGPARAVAPQPTPCSSATLLRRRRFCTSVRGHEKSAPAAVREVIGAPRSRSAAIILSLVRLGRAIFRLAPSWPSPGRAGHRAGDLGWQVSASVARVRAGLRPGVLRGVTTGAQPPSPTVSWHCEWSPAKWSSTWRSAGSFAVNDTCAKGKFAEQLRPPSWCTDRPVTGVA
jgi:hypothetical protein